MDRSWRIAIIWIVGLTALLSARPYAGSWNDGSRLASVESLVERGTLVIDDSIFVTPPQTGRPSPYRPDDPIFQSAGTKDKLLIDGHYYSDKSPVPVFPMAAIYGIFRGLGAPSAAERPDCFCLLMTWFSSGISLLIAALCIFAIVRRCRISPNRAGLLTFLFVFGTTALPYAQHVNNHIMLMAVASGLFLQLLIGEQEGWRLPALIRAGLLAGIVYTIDLGAGPPLTALTLGYLAWQMRSFRTLLAVAAAVPWIAFHHVVNYAIGGTLIPANAVPAYLDWPGSPFSSQNATGGWAHSSPIKLVLYAFDMMLGKKGFLGHNLLLFLVVFSLPLLIRRKYADRRIVLLGLLWSLMTWLLYAATSTNLSGGCVSIRWFVPLLVPGFLAIAIIVREERSRWKELYLLAGGGLLLAAIMADRGPWFQKILPMYWVIYPGTVACWLAVRWNTNSAVNDSDMPTVYATRITLAERIAANPTGDAVEAASGSANGG